MRPVALVGAVVVLLLPAPVAAAAEPPPHVSASYLTSLEGIEDLACAYAGQTDGRDATVLLAVGRTLVPAPGVREWYGA